MEISNKKIWLYGLLEACSEGNPLPDCPFEKYRSLTSKEKLTLLEQLSEEEVDEKAKYHRQCVICRV